MAEELQLKYKDSEIHYYKFGQGATDLICLHGYGKEAKDFLFLEKHICTQYTVYSIDLPFHGKTNWKQPLLFTDKELLEIVDLIIGAKKKFSILGYSMGGRIALHLLHDHPERLNKLMLIAPDGLNANIMYSLVTQTKAGNKIFSASMKNPGWIYKLMAGAKRFNLYDKGMLQLAKHYLESESNRNLLYKRWITMRRFKPDLKKVKQQSARHKIPVHIIFGDTDFVIPFKYGNKLRGADNIQMKTIPGGHFLIREQFAPYIVNMLSTE